MAKRKLVVVGNGMAGARAVENVLARGGGDLFDIVVFGDEPYGNYNRILLSSILTGAQAADDILINPLDWYRDNGVLLHAGERIETIDRAAKRVRSAGGIEAVYDILLIATGSRAFIPPIKNAHDADGRLKPGLFGYRSLDDCRAIATYAAGCRKAVTIGGGLLGLEAARALMSLGCESHVVHLAPHLLEVQLDSTGGAFLRQTMEGLGIHVHTDAATTEVIGSDKVEGLVFKDGTRLDCDLVVVAAGIRPNAEIGLRAGLTIERAIVVNDHMQSVDDMSVYAVGECAQHRGRVYGLVAPLWDQARVFADHVTERDRNAAYHGSKLATKLKVMGVEVASMGITEPAESHDEVIQFADRTRGTYKKLIVRNDRLVGGILMGEISKAAYLMQAFDRGTPLPEERLALLFDFGMPVAAPSLDDMPGDTQVCNCNAVSKAAIGACVVAGRSDARAVMAETRAGMGCGSCKGQVEQLVAWFGERQSQPVDTGVAPAPAGPDARLRGEIRGDGTLSFISDGEHCTPAQLLRIAEVAMRFNVPSVRLAGADRVDLVGVAQQDRERIWSELHTPLAAE